MTSFKVEGMDKVLSMLKNLDDNVAAKAVRQSLRAGGKVAQGFIVSNAKGSLKRRVKVRAGKRSRTRTSIRIGIIQVPGAKDAFVSFQEFGHRVRKHGSKRIKGTHDLLRGAELGAPSALTTATEVLTAGVYAQIRELSK